MRRTIRTLIAAGAAVLALGSFAAPANAAQATCSMPESNAQGLFLTGFFHTNGRVNWVTDPTLTVAVAAHPSITPAHRAAISRAITKWNGVLTSCLDGAVTLTEVSGAKGAQAKATIILHFTPHRGGRFTAGVSMCLPGGCQVYVSQEGPPAHSGGGFTPTDLYHLTLHELGHSLGLGHATNIGQATDVMGYGWMVPNGVPVISDCDVDALAYVWSWAIAGTAPVQPALGVYDCAQS